AGRGVSGARYVTFEGASTKASFEGVAGAILVGRVVDECGCFGRVAVHQIGFGTGRGGGRGRARRVGGSDGRVGDAGRRRGRWASRRGRRIMQVPALGASFVDPASAGFFAGSAP